MMTILEMRTKLHEFIDLADDNTIVALYDFVQTELNEDSSEVSGDHWEDEEFLKELDRRTADFESGRDLGVPWEEVQKIVEANLKAIKSRD